MKTILLTLFFSLAISSCATGPLPAFKKESNCSPRALDKIKQSKTSELAGQVDIADASRPMRNDLRACILDKVVKIDFSELKGQTILQPLKVDFPR